MTLKGHVDRVDQFLIAGWAISDDDPLLRVTVNIVQNDQVTIALTPQFDAPSLRGALGLEPSDAPPAYAWRLWMPVANGLHPDVPFSIVIAETGAPLALGANRTIRLLDDCDPAALADLEQMVFTLPPSMTLVDGDLQIRVGVEHPAATTGLHLHVGSEDLAPVLDYRGFLGRTVSDFSLKISPDRFQSAEDRWLTISPTVEGKAAAPCGDLNIPATVFFRDRLVSPLPESENIARVSGSLSDPANYLIGGLTTFLQMDALASECFGRRITDYETVVDWGVGCARVIRHFWESAPALSGPQRPVQTLIGVDIDPVNIDWCNANMGPEASYRLLSLSGFDLPDASVDFLYGVSVLTHLTEHHQHLWLGEIRRILRPGAVAIVTVHGEGVYYRQPRGLMTPFVEKFGFFDGVADGSIGADRDRYYRASYHSRRYIRENWRQYFNIVRTVPMANAFVQDMIVLQKR